VKQSFNFIFRSSYSLNEEYQLIDMSIKVHSVKQLQLQNQVCGESKDVNTDSVKTII